MCDTENVNCFNDDANVNLGCVRLSSGCRHKQQTSARLKKTNIFSNLQVSPDDNLTDITNRFFCQGQFRCGICKQTWLLLRTDAGRAVTTSVYGPVYTILVQFLSVFHSRFSFSLPQSRLYTTSGQCDRHYCCDVYMHQKSVRCSYN